MKERIDFSQAPYLHNMAPGSPNVYSGKYIVRPHQWGIYTLDTDTGAFRMLSGVGKTDAGFQHPAITITGDCWQGCTKLAASPHIPKWVVYIGIPPNCAASGLPAPAENVQVYRLDGPAALRRVGQVHAPLVNRNSAPLLVHGDFCFAPEGIFPSTLFTAINLNDFSITESVVAPADIPPPQPNINSYTYDIHQVTQQAFYAERQGGSVALPTYCPRDFVSRQHMAVFLLKSMHGANYQPPPATGTMFSDVPLDHPYGAWIEQLAREGITAGKSPCEAPPTPTS